MKLSIVIPVYNEVDSISRLYQEIIQSVKINEYEIIFIDDGSTDGSSEKIQGLIKDLSLIHISEPTRPY